MSRYLILFVTLVAIIGAIVYFEKQKARPGSFGNNNAVTVFPAGKDLGLAASPETQKARLAKAEKYPLSPELVGISGYLNTAPLKLADLVGKKVILVDFWTYSCINCQRTTPYLNAWYEKYREAGLEIVGIHTPEFEFEKKTENVQKAITEFGIKYPVVQDNEYGTWNAFRNRYWPRKYLVDIDGYVVYDHIGEGGYEETEQKIQELLAERQARLGAATPVGGGLVRPGDAVTTIESESPETYFGSARNELLANGRSHTAGAQPFAEPRSLIKNALYLSGNWNFDAESAANQSANSKIYYRYSAKGVYLVASSEKGIRAEVLKDGRPLGSEAGADIIRIDGHTYVDIQEDRLYRLIDDTKASTAELQIIIPEAGLKAFAFTFG